MHRRTRRRNTDRRRQPRSGSIRHDAVPHLTDSTSRSSSPALDPQRRRSCKSAFATSTSPSIFLAYRRFPHLRRTNHAPQRRQPTHSSAAVALTHLRRAQTSIALGARGATACNFPRVPSLKAFGRRPRCKPHRCDRPASETLNRLGSRATQSRLPLFPQQQTFLTPAVTSEKCHSTKAEVYPQQSVQPATRHPSTWAQQLAPRRLGTTRTRTDA